MKKNLTTIALLIYTIGSVIAQNISISGQIIDQTENYIEYQREITEAENMMFDSLFTESVQQYKYTFEKFSFNFPKDCIVAAQVASIINDNNSAFYFLRKAVRFGAKNERISQIRLLQKLEHDTLQWNTYLNEYDSLCLIYKNSIDWEYKRLCDSFYQRDQEIRNIDQKALNNRYIPWRRKLRKKWENNCTKGLQVLIDSLTPTKGFPSYRTIGLIDSNTRENGNYSLSSAHTLVLFYHFPEYICKYLDLLHTELIAGNISARDYAVTLEFYNRNSKSFKDGNSSQYYIRWEVPPRPKECYPLEDSIDKRRKEIGLSNCKYERMRKLWQHHYFSKKTEAFELFYYEF